MQFHQFKRRSVRMARRGKPRPRRVPAKTKPAAKDETQGTLNAADLNGAGNAEVSVEARKAENTAIEGEGSKHALSKFVHACDTWLKEMDADDLVAADAHFTAVRGKLALAMKIFSECRRGRRGAAAEAIYQQHRKAFCDLVMEIKSTLDFAVGVERGWCYLLERHGLRKGDSVRPRT